MDTEEDSNFISWLITKNVSNYTTTVWKFPARQSDRGITNPDASSPLYALVTKRPSNIPLLYHILIYRELPRKGVFTTTG
jgi:hypothetical protein